MSRLADRININGVEPRTKVSVHKWFPFKLREAEHIIADNVSRYVFNILSEKEELPIAPNLAPPFETFWVEMNRPNWMLSQFGWDWLPYSWGVLFNSLKIPQMPNVPDGGWTMSAYLVAEPSKGHISYYGNATILLDHYGALLNNRFYPVSFIDSDDSQHRWMTVEEANHLRLMKLLFPALLTISFLHCKNVEYVPSFSPAKVHKAYERKHKSPMVRFHVLNITPMKKVLRKEGDIEHNGLKNALHICRGHFKDYRKRGLFGKIKGVFWWDSFIRGSAESGVTLKDYDVNAPKDSEP